MGRGRVERFPFSRFRSFRRLKFAARLHVINRSISAERSKLLSSALKKGMISSEQWNNPVLLMRMLSLSPHRTAPLTQHRKDKQYISPKGPWWPCSVYSLSYLLEEVLVGRSRDKQCSDNGKLWSHTVESNEQQHEDKRRVYRRHI